MERYDLKSVASLIDSTSLRKSRDFSFSSSIRAPSLAPVFRHQKLTDFSISRILSLEDDDTQKESKCPAVPAVHCCHTAVQTPSPQHSCSDTSPQLSPCSDNTSSASDFDSEPDQVSTHTKQPPRKKRQRTTFSPIELWELERAYRRQPYLMSKVVEDLVKRLGITAKSVKYWFQNRRAKSRKEESRVTPLYHSSQSNQFGRLVRRAMPSERPQSLIQCSSDHRKHSNCMSYPVENHLEVRAHSQPIKRDYQHLPFKSNQLRSRSPMFHPDQFKRRPLKSARLPYSGGLLRHQPY